MKGPRILLVLFCLCVRAMPVGATPSTHIWSPSTDIQADKSVHLTMDMYVPAEKDGRGKKPDTVSNFGLTGGFWPIENKLGFEGGFDVINGYEELDNYPFYFNAKVGTPEDALFALSPALAFGAYDFGTEYGKTNFNLYYVKGARTLKAEDFSLGRLSFGWFWGNSDLMLDDHGSSTGSGVLLAWERTMPMLSEKLWLCVDYQGSSIGFGALVPGFSWKFSDAVSVIFGYVIPNNSKLAESFTVQVDIDL